jgi:hypothetical protein
LTYQTTDRYLLWLPERAARIDHREADDAEINLEQPISSLFDPQLSDIIHEPSKMLVCRDADAGSHLR